MPKTCAAASKPWPPTAPRKAPPAKVHSWRRPVRNPFHGLSTAGGLYAEGRCARGIGARGVDSEVCRFIRGPDTVAVRLNAFLARSGVASRRSADELIRAGRVHVNGEPGRFDTEVGRRDRVELDGRRLALQPLTYVLLNKPAGTVTTARDPQGRATVVDLVDLPVRIVPVGRLDADTTGVLLLTNDGDLAHRLAHPRYEVEKVYRAQVAGDPDGKALDRLRNGIELDDGPTAPARVRRLAPGRLELTLHEGRNRQVRRMGEAVGHPVRRLERVRYAGLDAQGIGPGEWRELTRDEVEDLRRRVGLAG
jgi:23S rRNA pseudouridine2605 synthase